MNGEGRDRDLGLMGPPVAGAVLQTFPKKARIGRSGVSTFPLCGTLRVHWTLAAWALVACSASVARLPAGRL